MIPFNPNIKSTGKVLISIVEIRKLSV
jgi:hypothetical protein